jgi:predicted DNA-binding transcriptional regulator YafY
MSEVLLRTLEMLQLIPRHPKSIGTTDLTNKLERRGYKTTPRTIQRVLNKLRDPLGIERRGTPNAYRWRWPDGAAVFEAPNMDAATALTLKLSREFLARVLPPEAVERLSGHIARAEKVLATVPNKKLASWPRKIRITSAGMPARYPTVPAAILDVVARALLEDRRFKCTYQKRAGEVREYEVSPIALVYRDAFPYLVCVLNKHEEGVVTLVPHRIQAASLLPGASQAPKDFDLDEFVRAGGTGFLYGPQPLELAALVHKKAAPTIAELPIADNQSLRRYDDDRLLLEATVPNSVELQTWVLGFGDAVEVLAPEELRERLRAVTENLAGRYARASGVEATAWGTPAVFADGGYLWAGKKR